jgi:hypothetical protein
VQRIPLALPHRPKVLLLLLQDIGCIIWDASSSTQETSAAAGRLPWLWVVGTESPVSRKQKEKKNEKKKDIQK